MPVSQTQTVREITTQALIKLGVVSADNSAPEAFEADLAAAELNRMLKAWQAKHELLWTTARQSVTLTTDAEYTLSPERPFRILNARLKQSSGIEIPMNEMTRDEYDMLPLKTSTGLPTNFYFDRQRENARFLVWPVLSAANGETIEISYEREMEDVTDLNATIDVPAEWYDAVVYNLAARLSDSFMIQAPSIEIKAQISLDLALSDSIEGSVYFGNAHS